MYKIYFNDRLLQLIPSTQMNNFIPASDHTFLAPYRGKPHAFLNYIQVLQRGKKYDAVVLFGDDVDQMMNDLKSLFKVIIAGGGIVINTQGEVLLIKRLGYWDLPKGKIEKGEDTVSGAIREVSEETGVEVENADKALMSTYHTYIDRIGQKILKETVWFPMIAEGGVLSPQKEESIDDARWISGDQIFNLEGKMYKNIRLVLKQYFELYRH